MSEREPQVIEAIGSEVPPQIFNEDLMTDEERIAAYKKVSEWYAAHAPQDIAAVPDIEAEVAAAAEENQTQEKE